MQLLERISTIDNSSLFSNANIMHYVYNNQVNVVTFRKYTARKWDRQLIFFLFC